MQFLLEHWHCILPALGIIAAMFFMRDKDKEKKDSHNSSRSVISTSQNYNDNIRI